MDAHQRAMWTRMLDRIDALDAGTVELGELVRELRGLFVEANSHDQRVRDDFEVYWSAIDAQHELRTESWAPSGTADDRALRASVDAFRRWVQTAVLADKTDHHN